MKFIVLTNSGLNNNFVEELIDSKLKPCLIVTDSPYYSKKKNIIKFLLGKTILVYKYFKNKSQFKKKYQAYFLAKKYSIQFWPSYKVNTKEFVKLLKEMDIDYGFVFTFRLIKKEVFSSAKFGFINFHPALLPHNRGASPSNFVILNNQAKTGITFHLISKGIDNGSIIEQYEISLSGFETAKILNEYLLSLGSFLFVKLIYKLFHNYKYSLINNDINKGSYEPPFSKKYSIINENSSLEEIDRVIRASRVENQFAVYNFKENEYNVLNCIDMSECNLIIDNYPHIDDYNNIYLKLPDKKIVLLIIKTK